MNRIRSSVEFVNVYRENMGRLPFLAGALGLLVGLATVTAATLSGVVQIKAVHDGTAHGEGGVAGGCSSETDCFDSSNCTQDLCVEGSCQNPLTCAPVNPTCFMAACVDDECVVVPINCDDEEPCTDDLCDEDEGGCVHPYNSASCDDGDACTTGDTCSDGSCVGGTALPGCCNTDADCIDEDPCNGTETCALSCQATVCDIDLFCCETQWDGQCAGEANDLCAICADPESSNCCSAHDFAGCDETTGTCVGGTAIPDCCTADADCFDDDPCNGAETCGLSNCCFEHPGVGCDNETCQATVCGIDPFCCNTEWDSICAEEANDLCAACSVFTCVGGTPISDCCTTTADCIDDDQCNGAETCDILAVINCCFAHGEVGCDDGSCQANVCDIDPFCCDTAWDSICAAEANDLCAVCATAGAGTCVDGTPLDCDDEDPCTDDSCDADEGCVHTPICDADDDGVLDDSDACPHSDTSPTIVIEGCATGVSNHLFANGCTMADAIATCAAQAQNHGAFVSCVTASANAWRQQGLITARQRAQIVSCAAHASIP